MISRKILNEFIRIDKKVWSKNFVILRRPRVIANIERTIFCDITDNLSLIDIYLPLAKRRRSRLRKVWVGRQHRLHISEGNQSCLPTNIFVGGSAVNSLNVGFMQEGLNKQENVLFIFSAYFN